MAPSEQRQIARKQLRELRDDITDLEGRLKHGAPEFNHGVTDTCNTIRRLLENKIYDLLQFHHAVD